MSPRTGRPPIDNPKAERVTVRLTGHQQKILADCAEKFGTSKADIICRGLSLMEIELINSEARQLLDAIIVLQSLIDADSPLVNEQVEQVKTNFAWYLDSIKK